MEETKPRFTVENAAELLSKPEPKIEWLIENIWLDKSRGLIAGNPGVGKTWIALDMLISVATGTLCLNRYPVKKGAVLLVEEEASSLNLQRRLHAMARARQLKDSDLTNLFLLTRQFTRIPNDATELFHLISENNIQLVVFDSLRTVHSADENSSSEMKEVLDSFGRLNTITEASIVLIHHLAKASDVSNKPLFERLRGSSHLWAWRDCILGIEGEEDASECICSFQFRDAEAQPPIRIKRHLGEMTGTIALEASGIEESEEFAEKSAAIISFIRAQFGPTSKEAVFKSIKGRKADFVRIFKRMASLKMIAQNGSGWHVPESAGTPGNTGT